MEDRKKFEEIAAEKFPTLITTICPQIQEAQWMPSTRSMKETVPKHIILNFFKDKRKY